MKMTGGIGLFGAFSSLAGDAISLTFDLMNYFENKAFHKSLLAKISEISSQLNTIETELSGIEKELKDIDEKLKAELSLSIFKLTSSIDAWTEYVNALNPETIAQSEHKEEIIEKAKEMLDPLNERSIISVLANLFEILSFNTIFKDQSSILGQISPGGFNWIQIKTQQAAILLAHACSVDTTSSMGWHGYKISQELHRQFKGMLTVAENYNFHNKTLPDSLWSFDSFIYPKSYIAKGNGIIIYGIDPIYLCPYHNTQPLLDYIVKNSEGKYMTIFKEPVSGDNDQGISPEQYKMRFYLDTSLAEYNFGYPPKCVSDDIDYKKFVYVDSTGTVERLAFKKSNNGYALIPLSSQEEADLYVYNEWDVSKKGVLGSFFKLTYPEGLKVNPLDIPECGFSFAYRRFQQEQKGWYLGACNGVPLWVDKDSDADPTTSPECYQIYDGENGPASDMLLYSDVVSGKVSTKSHDDLNADLYDLTYWKLMLSFEKDGSSKVLIIPAQCLLMKDEDKSFLTLNDKGDWVLKKLNGSSLSTFVFQINVPPVLQKLDNPYKLKPAAAHLTFSQYPSKIKKVVFHNSPYYFT